ncbi:uncharacterized protein LOC117801605 [Ailuropoda melanoleuca]|uniref:uncharacterized protein LOC117801605 n=1 Tax=Ailuropoda melanoleuca TaxID=9646 RepID=UPI001494B621|nr:uncharacterized protein LOC117801605 [Ailuropoda melanoleuca]
MTYMPMTSLDTEGHLHKDVLQASHILPQIESLYTCSWPEPGQSLLALVLHIAGGHIHSTAGHIVSVASGKTQPHCVCAGWGCRRARGWPSPQVASVVDSFRKRTRPALSRSLQLQDVVHVVPAHRRSILPQLLEAGQLSIDYQVSRRLPLKSSGFCQTGSRDAYAYGSPERTNYLGTSRVAFRGCPSLAEFSKKPEGREPVNATHPLIESSQSPGPWSRWRMDLKGQWNIPADSASWRCRENSVCVCVCVRERERGVEECSQKLLIVKKCY